jgi:hypothetical protein
MDAGLFRIAFVILALHIQIGGREFGLNIVMTINGELVFANNLFSELLL